MYPYLLLAVPMSFPCSRPTNVRTSAPAVQLQAPPIASWPLSLFFFFFFFTVYQSEFLPKRRPDACAEGPAPFWRFRFFLVASSFLGGRVDKHDDNVFRSLLDRREEGRAEEESSIRAAFSEDDGNKSCWQGVSLCTTDELFPILWIDFSILMEGWPCQRQRFAFQREAL